MRKFYLLRHVDVNKNSGTGVVAEGVIFDTGDGAYTWLTPHKTITVFNNIRTVKQLHSHGGATEVVIEGTRGLRDKFEACQAEAEAKKKKMRSLKSHGKI